MKTAQSTPTVPPPPQVDPPVPDPLDPPAPSVVDPPVSPVSDPVPPQVVDRGGNIHVSRGGAARPRLPHERDESADSQTGIDNDVDKVVQQAATDLRRGLVDTGTGPVIDRTYERVKRGD